VASNSFGVAESIQGTIVVLIRPVITVHPVSQSVAAGGNVTLSVSATGNPFPLSFRWRSNGLAVATLSLYDTNCFFTLTNVQPTPLTNQFRYSVAVTNLAGSSSSSLSSNAVLTVLADSDGDGLPDEWETVHGLSATNASDAILDSDGDGATNAEEYFAGTQPNNPLDYLRLEYVRANEPNLWTVRFTAVSNRTYTLMGRAGFSLGDAWRPIADVLAASTNRTVEIIRLPSNFVDQGFFRLVTPRTR